MQTFDEWFPTFKPMSYADADKVFFFDTDEFPSNALFFVWGDDEWFAYYHDGKFYAPLDGDNYEGDTLAEVACHLHEYAVLIEG